MSDTTTVAAALDLSVDTVLPDDGLRGTLIARVWRPEHRGPAVCVLRQDGVFDVTARYPTVADLLDLDSPAAAVREFKGELVAPLAELLNASAQAIRSPDRPSFLAPCDLQALKAAGVTFVASLLERVIEERAKGDPSQAPAIREEYRALVGGSLAKVKPGSAAAQLLQARLQAEGAWSQYLEVGIGRDAEIFTKSQPLSAVGLGAHVGVHPSSTWSNPEPEVVLAVSSKGRIVGATLGNDVNLRDFEGRSALLLGKSKDNNASCAIGPFLRLFDETFSLNDVRAAQIDLTVDGIDGFRLVGRSLMSMISRDPADLVAQAMGPYHQYPDGMFLFLGTMFAPVDDRDEPGRGFTHKVGDVVKIDSPQLGALINRVEHCDRAPPWIFGIRSFMRSLSGRGAIS
ncbi:MAG: fumarylacetoacetate hydrolase family protein [Bradyrhizobiaceae bacterium]|nr:fumarylacetoacetate hydrolase family protein [Bradyrhizobiaceae bacterium]